MQRGGLSHAVNHRGTTGVLVPANEDHPHWAAATKMLWSRTDGLPVREVRIAGGVERQLLEGITLVFDRPDVPLPLPREEQDQ